jgi:hypothetical protein
MTRDNPRLLGPREHARILLDYCEWLVEHTSHERTEAQEARALEIFPHAIRYIYTIDPATARPWFSRGNRNQVVCTRPECDRPDYHLLTEC